MVVKINGPSILCRSDEVGEICVQSGASGVGFWGLPGKTTNVFQVRNKIFLIQSLNLYQVQPLDENKEPANLGSFMRTGLLGFVGEGGLVFICGTMDGLIQIAGRRHNTEDLIATVMAVEPHSFIYKGR